MAMWLFLGINIVAVAGSRMDAGKHKCLKDEGNSCVFDFAYLQWPCLFFTCGHQAPGSSAINHESAVFFSRVSGALVLD